MSRKGVITIALAAVFVVAALVSATASAAPAEWMLNGKTLLEEGLTTAALSTTGKVDRPGVLSSSGLTIECTGGEALDTPEAVMPNRGKAKSLIAEGCKVTAPKSCSVPTTLGSVPVEFEATLDGALAVKGIVRSQSGKVFTTVAFAGTECAAAGNKSISGDVEVLAPEGQDERTDQLWESKQGATGLLKLGSETASAEGSVLLLLTSDAAWSFL